MFVLYNRWQILVYDTRLVYDQCTVNKKELSLQEADGPFVKLRNTLKTNISYNNKSFILDIIYLQFEHFVYVPFDWEFQ